MFDINLFQENTLCYLKHDSNKDFSEIVNSTKSDNSFALNREAWIQPSLGGLKNLLYQETSKSCLLNKKLKKAFGAPNPQLQEDFDLKNFNDKTFIQTSSATASLKNLNLKTKQKRATLVQQEAIPVSNSNDIKNKIANFNFLNEKLIFSSYSVYKKDISLHLKERKRFSDKFKNLIREKYSIDLKVYIDRKKDAYKYTLSEEDEFLQNIFTKFENYEEEATEKAVEIKDGKEAKDAKENQAYPKAINNKAQKAYFFLSNQETNKNPKFIKCVPYICPFEKCKRQFFNLTNCEKHLNEH